MKRDRDSKPARAAVPRADHLADAELVALSRRAGSARPARLAAHLARCSRCRGTLRAFELLRAALRLAPAEPGAGTVARAWAIMEPREPRSPRAGAQNPFLIARLISDSGEAVRAGVVRAPIASRQRVWRIPGADVAIRMEPPGLGSAGFLHGQILPRKPGALPILGGHVWLYRGARLAQSGVLGASGDFELAVPESRKWRLWLEWGEFRAQLEWS